MGQSVRDFESGNRSEESPSIFLKQLRRSRQPVRLTINGEKELLIQDAGSYQLLVELVERLETIAGVKKSMESFERGEGQVAQEALDELGRKHGISS